MDTVRVAGWRQAAAWNPVKFENEANQLMPTNNDGC